MRGVIVIIAIVCLLSACSYTGQTSKWDYYSPDNVTCFEGQIKFCRQFGAHMICECVV